MSEKNAMRLEADRQNAEFIVLTSLNFFYNNNYKFLVKDNWGTELDWKKQLWHNEESTFINKFVKELIYYGILVAEIDKKVVRQNKSYQKFILVKDWIQKVQYIYIEKHFVLRELENTWGYTITRP